MEDGEDITGLNIFDDYLAVHKESCIYLGNLVSTSSIFNFTRKSTPGTICNNTIQNLPTGEQIFLSRDGLRVFNGISSSVIEAGIIDELRETINPSYIHKSWSVVVPELNEYWLGVAIGSQTGPDTVYKFNYVTRQCFKDTRVGIRSVGKYQATTDLTWDSDTGTWDSAVDRWDDVAMTSLFPTVLFGDSSGLVTKRDTSVSDDNSVAINAYRETKDFEGDVKGGLARWLECQIWAKGNSVTVHYSTDGGNTWNFEGVHTLASDYPSDDSPVYAYFDTVSSRLRLKFSYENSGETFSLKDFIIGYNNREVRR
jgi:hypothetical protein